MTDKTIVTYVFWCPHREVSYALSPNSDGTYFVPDPRCRECSGKHGGVVAMMIKSMDGRCVHNFKFNEGSYETPGCEWCGVPYGSK